MFEQILIRGTNWIGDSIITIPALRELRRLFPEASLTLLARPWVVDIFKDSDLVNNILTYDSHTESFWSCVKKLRSQNFDAAFLFQNAFEAAALAFCARIPTRIGFPTDSRSFLLTERIPLSAATLRKHQLYYYLDLISIYEERITGSMSVNFSNPNYQLKIAEESKQKVLTNLINNFGLDPSLRWIAINPGATNGLAKRWPTEYFATLIDYLIKKEDCEICITGSAIEQDIANEIVARVNNKKRVSVFTGKMSLAESIAMLTWCDVVISNDTGTAYLAAALDRPLLTIFGPTDPNMISPFSTKAHIIRSLVHCAPCILKTCPIDHRCMQNLKPDVVHEQVLKILGSTQILRKN